MSDQQPTSSPTHLTYDETEAWGNMISCIYNFLTSSTNLASILEANYISTVQEPQMKQQLFLLPPPNPEEFHLSDFPWFLDLLLGAYPENQSSYHTTVSNEVNPVEFSYSSQDTMAEPNQISPSTSYNRVYDTYETRYVLSSQCPSNYNLQYEAGFTDPVEPDEEPTEYNSQTAVNQESDETCGLSMLNRFSDHDPEVIEETVESSYVKLSSSFSDTPPDVSPVEPSSKPDSKEDIINVKDNVSEETYFDEYTESNHTMNLPDSKYVSLVDVSNESTSRFQLDQQISAKLPRDDLLQTLGDFSDIMKSEEIQTVVNKRYNCTLKALITRSAEQQMPWEEIIPKTLEKPRPSLENMYATAAIEDVPQIINQIEKHLDEQEHEGQDQEVVEATCSNIPGKEKLAIKSSSKDLKAKKDSAEKILKSVQGSIKNLNVKSSTVKLVNVELNPEAKESNEKVNKQLSKNTGPKLKRRNPIIAKKDTQQDKDMKPSTSKDTPLQKPTGKQEQAVTKIPKQGMTKIPEPKRIIPKQYASIESTVRRFIQDGMKSTEKPKDKPTVRKPVHPNEMKALQNTLDKAKLKAEAVVTKKNLSSQPVLIPKKAPNIGGSKVSSLIPTPKSNLKSQSMVLGNASKGPSRNITKSPEIPHEHAVLNPAATTRTQRKSPIRSGGHLKATSELMSKKADTGLQSKKDTVMPLKKQERDSKPQENKTVKRVVLPTVKKTK
ncbi:unnamed protein product [Callosobruchus maculatus]|uniref:Uncharacterized protein n=1 Tax=Callosobruchus maculatus TaxID=64391 RepID=A0A653BF86_CALMS|nr:unnamed protein product [Callosobruchus maculatus]